jgi:hypothetical protein
LQHYDRNAESFRDGTRDHDVSQNIDALLSAITAPPPFRVLGRRLHRDRFLLPSGGPPAPRAALAGDDVAPALMLNSRRRV